MISLIAAIGKNRVIGKDNDMPWQRIPADMKRFVLLTMGKPIVMGRETFRSIGGKPLKGRTNIVLTRDPNLHIFGCVTAHSVNEVLHLTKQYDETMVIGGAQIYEAFMPLAKWIYLTVIDENFDGDTFFPEFDWNDWNELRYEEHQPDEDSPYLLRFYVLERK